MTVHTSTGASQLISYLTCDSFSCTMFRRKKSCDKKLLEHKLYLARESPELTFDISGCGLWEVPTGIFSLCHVFLKESLVLCHNRLRSLSGGGDVKDLGNLKILNISHNEFEYLSDDVGLLRNLQELYLDHNKLKTLPDSLCNLVNLKVLTISHNKLKHLPDDIGLLKSLHTLDMVENQVTKLPKSFYKLSQLKVLNCDQFPYLPSEVVRNGSEAIIKFICSDGEVEFSDQTPQKSEDLPELKEAKPDQFQEQISGLERRKMEKAQEFLMMERQNEILKEQEIQMANAHKANKKQLLEEISLNQSQLDLKIGRFQQARDAERFRLIEHLQEAENRADLAINNLLTLKPAARLMEKEEEEQFSRSNENLRKQEILNAMQDILKQESELFNKYSLDKREVSRSILEQELQSDRKLEEILHNQDGQKSSLIQKLVEDSHLQKAAVGTLLERGDLRSWGLLQQVRLVESQLAALTTIELDRKKLKMDQHINDLAQKRHDLSELLVDLLEQRQIRRAQLISTVRALERSNVSDVEDFWLRQYQSLLQKELQSDRKLGEILHNQDGQKSSLIQKLVEDSHLQKAAVGTLLERGDLRSWGLLQQVRLVESQLAALTTIELDRKKLKMDQRINDLAQKRHDLSELLVDLLEQRQIRRAQLISTIRALERSNVADVEDFWLRQYQSLLQKLPEGLSQAQKNLDPKLAEALLINGVLHCVPFLAKLTQKQSNLDTITDADLLEAGVASVVERQKILDCLCAVSTERICYEHAPSAPVMEEDGAPSAPPALDSIKAITSVECVICLDAQCHVIFVPCGHFCCCSTCSIPVLQCPLCRTDIQKRITMDVQ